MSRSGVLQAGEPVLLIDRKKRRYLIDLEEGGEFHSHSGVLPHDELIGKPEGETYRSSRGMVFIAIRPTITDFVLKMPRGAQVVYPKDIGPILIHADIFPGPGAGVRARIRGPLNGHVARRCRHRRIRTSRRLRTARPQRSGAFPRR